MAAQRRLGLAYRGSYTSAASSLCRLGDVHHRDRPLAERFYAGFGSFGVGHITALLDEEFDEFFCEPACLLRLVNQP